MHQGSPLHLHAASACPVSVPVPAVWFWRRAVQCSLQQHGREYSEGNQELQVRVSSANESL